MGSFLDKPKTEKTTHKGDGNQLSYGLSAMQGWRIEMEDAHCSLIGLPRAGLEQWSFFAVFDGHAGATVSKYSSEELIKSILDTEPALFDDLAAALLSSSSARALSPLPSSATNDTIADNDNNNSSSSPTSSTTKLISTNSKTTESNNSEAASTLTSSSQSNLNNVVVAAADTTNSIKTSNSNSSLSTNKSVTSSPTAAAIAASSSPISGDLQARLSSAIRQGFLNLDAKIRSRAEFERGEDKSGSTAVACLVSPTHIYLINCGDSRAIAVSDNQIVLHTLDHKPINPVERERIHNAGGSVMIQRVNGSLAVSRALGDYEYKSVEGKGPCEQLVSPEPEIYVHERTDKDEFVVLACDGIWDVMTNEDLKEFVHARLKVTDDLVKVSNEVLDTCLSKVSCGNIFQGSFQFFKFHVSFLG